MSELYTVESILEHRKRRGKSEFYIKWLGYDHTHNSWEPKDNIIDPQLIDAFFVREAKRSEEMKIRKEKLAAQAAAAGETGESSSAPSARGRPAPKAAVPKVSASKPRGRPPRARGARGRGGRGRGGQKRLAGGDIRPDSESDEDGRPSKKAKEAVQDQPEEVPEVPEDEEPAVATDEPDNAAAPAPIPDDEEFEDEEEEVIVPKKKKVVEPEVPEEEEEGEGAEEEEHRVAEIPEDEETLPDDEGSVESVDRPDGQDIVEVKNDSPGAVAPVAAPVAEIPVVDVDDDVDGSEVDNTAAPSDASDDIVLIENGGAPAPAAPAAAPPAPLPSNADEPIVLGDDE